MASSNPMNSTHRGAQKTLRVALKIGKHNAEAMAAQATTLEPKSQYHIINTWIEKRGLKSKFDILPPNADFIFWPIGDHSIEGKATTDVKLFCGEIDEYQTWAFMIINERKPPQLQFVNEHRTGDIGNVSQFDDMALMYLFRVFKKFNNDYARRQLEDLILYLFLINGHASRVFAKAVNPARLLLSSGISRVVKAYEEKGINNVPDMHQPSEDLSTIRSNVFQPAAANDLPSYNDDKSSDAATVVPTGPPLMGPPPIPLDADDVTNLGSQFEAVSVSDFRPSPPRVGNKRGREDEEDFGRYKKLVRGRKDLLRKQRECKEKSTKLKKTLMLIKAKDEEMKKDLEALLANKTRDEFAAWLMRYETIDMEEEESEGVDNDMEVEE